MKFFCLGLTRAGQSMADLDKLVLMSHIFGVSTDYLLKEENIDAYVETEKEDVTFDYSEKETQEVSLVFQNEKSVRTVGKEAIIG